MATKTVRYVGIAVVAVIALLLLIAISIPLFLNTDTFRQRIETTLSTALGRKVSVQKLDLSVLSGSLVAHTVAIADDPAFSKTAFVQAKSLKVGVELIPLIFSKTLNVTELTLNQPAISLVRSENGEKWNFSSLGNKSAAEAKPAAATSSSNPNLSVGELKVSNGRLTVSRRSSSSFTQFGMF